MKTTIENIEFPCEIKNNENSQNKAQYYQCNCKYRPIFKGFYSNSNTENVKL